MKKICVSIIFIIMFAMMYQIVAAGEQNTELVIGKEIVVDKHTYVIMGDVSRDNRISAIDALMVLKYSADIEKYDEEFLIISDVNSDTKINSIDALVILQYAAKAIPIERIEIYEEQVKVEKIGGGGVETDDVKLITSYDEYCDYISSIEENCYNAFEGNADQIKGYFDESFFTTQNIIAVCIDNDDSGSAEQILEGLYYDYYNGKYIVNIKTYIKQNPTPDTGSWCMFVSVSKEGYTNNIEVSVVKEWEKISEDIEFKSLRVAYDMYDKPSGIEIISTYEEYLAKIESIEASAFYKNEDIDICNEEFFDNNSLLIGNITTPSGSYYDFMLDKITLIEDVYNIYLEALCTEQFTNDVARWIFMIPLEGKQWENCEFDIAVETYYTTFEYLYSNSSHASLFTVNRDETIPGVEVISTYEDYVEYIKYIYEQYQQIPRNGVPLGCRKEYFEKNSLLVARYEETSGSYNVSYGGITEKDGVYYINIERSTKGEGTADMKPWEIMIAVEGKIWEDKNIQLNLGDLVVLD